MQAVADGLNEAANTALVDIQQHVNIDTGCLRDSYHITQIATPENLQAGVDSPLNYKDFNYPPVRNIRPEINRGLQGNPLFPADGSTDKLEAIARQAIDEKINQRFQW